MTKAILIAWSTGLPWCKKMASRVPAQPPLPPHPLSQVKDSACSGTTWLWTIQLAQNQGVPCTTMQPDMRLRIQWRQAPSIQPPLLPHSVPHTSSPPSPMCHLPHCCPAVWVTIEWWIASHLPVPAQHGLVLGKLQQWAGNKLCRCALWHVCYCALQR